MKILKRFFLVILWSGVIFFLSSMETTPTPSDTLLNFLLKKTAHVVEYAILYWLTWRAVNQDKKTIEYLWPLIFVVLYAISDEVHQSFVPGRHARAYDVGFDTLGASLIILGIKRRYLKNSGK